MALFLSSKSYSFVTSLPNHLFARIFKLFQTVDNSGEN